MNEDNTVETSPDGADVTPSDGQEAVENVANTISLEDLKRVTGKEFKDVDSALKSIKDTNKYVGKRQDDVKEAAIQSLDETVKEELRAQAERNRALQEKMFYIENPQYKAAKGLIDTIGGNPYEVVEQDGFKESFEKIASYDKSQGAQNVLQSNSKINSDNVIEKMDQAKKTGTTEDWSKVVEDIIKQ